MDIKDAEDKLNQVDSLLTTLTKVLKKHWLILLLILFGAFTYFVVTDDSEYIEEDQTEEVSAEYYDDSTYIDETSDENGVSE